MESQNKLRNALSSIDHRGYPAYKNLRGRWDFGDFVLSIDHVQGDPFAAPSSLSVIVPAAKAGFPAAFAGKKHRKTALEDHLIRRFARELGKYSFKAGGSGKSGLLSTSHPGQEVIERSACHADPADGSVTMRFEAGFPAAGRTVLAGNLAKMLFDYIPACVRACLMYGYYSEKERGALQAAIELADDQQFLREYIRDHDLVAFVADGSVLPRESGSSDRPLRSAVHFRSPESLRITLTLPDVGELSGMALRRGITVITGGGYHGKSTLLQALERGVYNHIAGDGREYVVTDETAVKVRAEDGRSIAGVDISMFIRELPGGADTRRFYTDNASGSTSQAAAIVEAAESGTDLLLIDEDTSATNFMIRDALMLRVIHRDMEPITPLIERSRQLCSQGISMILAVGSSGSWFFPADVVIQMDTWLPYDITDKAKKAAAAYGDPVLPADPAQMPETARIPLLKDAAHEEKHGRKERRGDGRVKVKVNGTDAFSVNRQEINLRSVEQIADSEQTAALAKCLVYAGKNLMDGRRTMAQVADELETLIDEKGLGALFEGTPACGLARPRRQEIMAAIDRCRSLRIKED